MTTMQALRVVGTPVPQPSGPDKVTGEADYAADIILPGMLFGKALRSPSAHARILRVDASRARTLPGVHAVLTGADVRGMYVGRMMRDMPLLAWDRVRFIGEKVAAVAAESFDIAEEALSLIEVEYEELPSVFDPLEAMKEDAPVLHDDPASYEGAYKPIPPIPNVCSYYKSAHGDVEQGLAEADRVFEDTFLLPPVHQGYIEPHACVVSTAPDGSAEIWPSNKTPFNLRTLVAAAVGGTEERLRVHAMHVGGDFGGKGSFMDVPLCYLLSQHAGRPVKMIMTYTEELTAGNIRHPGVIRLRTGVMNDGRLVAQHAELIFNSGGYGAFKPVPNVNIGGAHSVGGSYRVPNVLGESYMIYTNNIPAGHMRAPGGPQMLFAVESQIDMIAHSLGMDPYEFRRQNALREGDTTPTGGHLEKMHGIETLDAAAEAAGLKQPKSGPNVGRGMTFYNRRPGSGKGTVKLTLDGPDQVTIHSVTADQGAGAEVVMQQVVAEVLGIEPAQIHLQYETTDAAPPDSGVGGSRATHAVGQGAMLATTQLRDRLCDTAGSLLDVFPEEVEVVPGGFARRNEASSPTATVLPFPTVAEEAIRREGGPIEVVDTYSPAGGGEGTITSFCAQVAEVEVDRETGRITVTKITTAHDVGTVINPMMHQGQIDGAIVQGFGYALIEELEVDNGIVQNANLGDYKLPNIEDVPQLVTVLLESPAGPTPYEGKAIGEIPNVPLAAAIANAVEDAVGVRITSLPITAEKLYWALHPAE